DIWCKLSAASRNIEALFEPPHFLTECDHLLGFGNLRHNHDVRASTHYFRKIRAALGFERIDPNRRNNAGCAPSRIDFGGHRARLWPTLWQGKILKFLN